MAKRDAKARRAAQAKADAKARTDNRPWFDRATEGTFWTPEVGTYTVLLTDEVRERISSFGKPVIDIPTNKGVISTGAFALQRPLAQAYKRNGALKGARLTFTATGDGVARRYEDVTVQVR